MRPSVDGCDGLLTMTRRQAVTATLASLPALLAAGAGWLQADAAKRSEARLYQEAGETLGEQSDEMLALQAKVDAILARCDPGPRGLIVQGNTFERPGVANILVREK